MKVRIPFLVAVWAAALAFSLAAQESPSPEEQIRRAEACLPRMRSLDSQVRLKAVKELGECGPHGRPAVPALLAALEDTEPDVRAAAAAALGSFPEDGAAIVPILALALHDPDSAVREQAAGRLGYHFDAHADLSLQGLLRATCDPCAGVRSEADLSLSHLLNPTKENLPTLLTDFKNGDAPRRRVVAYVLRQWREYEGKPPAADCTAAQEALRSALKDPDALVRAIAAQGLAWVLHRDATAELSELATSDREETVRAAALLALGWMCAEAKTVWPLLLRALDEPSPRMQAAAFAALLEYAELHDWHCAYEPPPRYWPPPKEIPERVRPFLSSPDPEVRVQAALVLGTIPCYQAEVAPLLAKLLKGRSDHLRRQAHICLRDMGYAARSATGELLDLLKAPAEWETFVRSVEVIERAHPSPRFVVPALLGVLEQAPPWIFRILSEYGADAAAARPLLLRHVREQPKAEETDDYVRYLCCIGLDDESAGSLSGMTLESSWAADVLFEALLPWPEHAVRFWEKNPGVLLTPSSELILKLFANPNPRYEIFRQHILERGDLSDLDMASTGDPRFLPLIEGLLKDAKPSARTRLLACARALGAKPDRVVKLSAHEPGDYRHASASPEGDPDQRRPEAQWVGATSATVLITGKVILPSGKLATGVRFIETAEHHWELGGSGGLATARLDPKTGRFCLLTKMHYEWREAANEDRVGWPEPWRTQPRRIRVEAEGAEPLEVEFFYGMPDVEITLTPR